MWVERDVAVVGGGIVGLATAVAVADSGASVRLYEPGVPGYGQSGGDGRIFRNAHDDPRLIELAREARAIWLEWEERFGVELISRGGSVGIGSAVEGRLAALERAGGFEAREIDQAELGERLPILAPYDGPAMFDPGGGSIRTKAAVGALAEELGDDLLRDEVLALNPRADGVEVMSGGERGRFAGVVVCAGRGTKAIGRSLGVEIPVELGAHARMTFRRREPAGTPLATLQDGDGRFGESGIYAAAGAGETSYGVGLSADTPAGVDGALTDPGRLAELADRASTYVKRALPGLDPHPVDIRTCWVTALPWGPDGLGVWETGRVHLIAGHNLFKLAPVLGRQLARAALGDPLPGELRPDSRLGALAAARQDGVGG